jgi:hypothetical protein
VETADLFGPYDINPLASTDSADAYIAGKRVMADDLTRHIALPPGATATLTDGTDFIVDALNRLK